ncbi:MAG: BlaI/MecI/CopY family transcriptional regulator [Thermoguttaceae bacterium]
MNNMEKITDAEWKLMHVLWNRGRASSNEVVNAIVPETGWSPNTVRTLLARLSEKGILQVEKEKGKAKEYPTCYYTPNYSREACEMAHCRTFLERVFAGDTTRLLAHLVRDVGLTPEQIVQLREQLER